MGVATALELRCAAHSSCRSEGQRLLWPRAETPTHCHDGIRRKS
jgi:hypothetical protein